MSADHCLELLRRAIQDQNDLAWDACIQLFHPFVMRKIYEIAPDCPPQEAAHIAYQTLGSFYREVGTSAQQNRILNSFDTVIHRLQREIEQNIADRS